MVSFVMSSPCAQLGTSFFKRRFPACTSRRNKQQKTLEENLKKSFIIIRCQAEAIPERILQGSGVARERLKPATEGIVTTRNRKNRCKQAELDHEVLETISLNGHTPDRSGINVSHERPECMISFDIILKNFTGETQEIGPLRCGYKELALHLPNQIIEKSIKPTVYKYFNAFERQH